VKGPGLRIIAGALKGRRIETPGWPGLRPTSEGVRVRLSGGRTSVVDGPFTETKEVVGGYAMLEAASMDEAIALTRRFLMVHGPEWELECEVRQVEMPAFESGT